MAAEAQQANAVRPPTMPALKPMRRMSGATLLRPQTPHRANAVKAPDHDYDEAQALNVGGHPFK